MSQDSWESLLTQLVSNPRGFLIQHWREQVSVIMGAPVFSALLAFLFASLGWWVSHYHYKKRIEGLREQLEIRKERLDLREDQNKRLKSEIITLQIQQKDQSNAPSVVSSNVFEIEHVAHDQFWREKNSRDLFPPFVGLPVPRDAIMVLQVRVKITAVPAQVITDVQLSLDGNRIRPHAGFWCPQLIEHNESLLCFDIPPSITLENHILHLVAKCQGGREKQSPVFWVIGGPVPGQVWTGGGE
jgi:hypothetical protein